MTLTPEGRETLFSWAIRAVVLMTAMPIHESAHALAASALGDDTAKKAGRLTLNPIKHLDLFGSLLLIFVGFGWAVPVPIDPRKFKNPRRGMAISAAAGPISNIFLAALFLTVFKIVYLTIDLDAPRTAYIIYQLGEIFGIMVSLNLTLAVFNLLPIPPLDGSKILGLFLPDSAHAFLHRYEKYALLLLFALLWTGILRQQLYILSDYLFRFLLIVTHPIDLLLS